MSKNFKCVIHGKGEGFPRDLPHLRAGEHKYPQPLTPHH